MKKIVLNFKEFNESMNSSNIDTSNPILKYIDENYQNIKEVVEQAKSLIDDVIAFNEKEYTRKNVPFTDDIKNDIRIDVIYDLVACLSNYILPTDEIYDIVLNRTNGKIILKCMVKRDDKNYMFSTNVVLAHGIVQRMHYRYIPDTNLRKINSKFIEDTDDILKMKKEIVKYENKIGKYKLEIDEYQKRKNDIIKDFEKQNAKSIDDFRYNTPYDLLHPITKNQYIDEEDFLVKREEDLQERWNKHKERYSDQQLKKELSFYDKKLKGFAKIIDSSSKEIENIKSKLYK